MKFAAILLAIIFVIAVTLFILVPRGPNLAIDYRRQMDAESARTYTKQPAITEESIAILPEPIQRYLHASGTVGKPRVAWVHVSFDAEMFQKPGQAGMAGPAEQYDRFDGPKRIFYMQTKMYGLPVQVLHDYAGKTASMRVRIASLFDVENNRSEELARAESVTILNDLCLFAPSWLTDPRLEWEPIDTNSARVAFTNGSYRVAATLYVNAKGEVTDFVSDDRAAMQADGSLKKIRWSTPMECYREFNGRRFPTYGRTIYHYPEGDFTYGKFWVREVKTG